MNVIAEMQAAMGALVRRGKGILAADESVATITKRFKVYDIPSTEESRRSYRELLLTTPDLNDYISGVIFHEETLRQGGAAGQPLPDLVTQRGIVVGIKVDKGLIPLALAPGDQVTQGLDALADRLAAYRESGARFAKWRAVYAISPRTPSRQAITANAEALARYAATCQALGVVPIVEPEVLLDGDHDIDRCAAVTHEVLHHVFDRLYVHGVRLEYMLLKPNMVSPGKQNAAQLSVAEVAEKTVDVLRRAVPAMVPSVNFLSGGLSPERATAYLSAMNAMYPHMPWVLSFSFARALQDPALAAWRGRAENAAAAQRALQRRARLASAAQHGEYSETMERVA